MTDIAALEVFDAEVREFASQRHVVLERLFRELQHASANPVEADFGKAFDHVRSVLGKTEPQMSQLFKVSRATINRWIRGVMAPHPLVRKSIYDALLGEARQAFKSARVVG